MLKRAFISSLALLAACGQQEPTGIASSSGVQETCYSRGELDWGGPFTLVDQDGNTVTQDDYKGRYTLMFFGFTSCPDACPIIMERMIYAFDSLPENLQEPRAMMISFDPERDTPEQLKQYVSNEFFPDDMVGLTGSDEQISGAAEEFQAIYHRMEMRDSAMEYSFDHTTAIYLMDENWEMKSFFLPTETPQSMAQCMANFLPEA